MRSLRSRMEQEGKAKVEYGMLGEEVCRQGGVVAVTVAVESGGTGREGIEGERANARSVTPHCAHLPTRPTPKFELGSQPPSFLVNTPAASILSSSTHPHSPFSFPSSPLLTLPPIDPLHGKRTGRNVSPLTPSAYTTSICDPLRSLLLAERAISRGEPKVCVYMCARAFVCTCIRICAPFCRLLAGIDINVIGYLLSRAPYPLDNTPRRARSPLLVRHAAKRLDFARVLVAVAESVPRRDPIDPVASPPDITTWLLRWAFAYPSLSACSYCA